MKKLKIIYKIVLFCVLYVGGQSLIKYAVLDDTLTISRMMMHDLYTEDNIDILFCGASHCQLGIDPEVMDAGFNRNTFNAGSSSQGLETSLALIKEAEKYHDLQEIYVDLDYSIVMRELPNLESIYIVSDYMKPSLNKISFLLNATSFDYYVNSFMPLHKGRGYTKNPREILRILNRKNTPEYRDYLVADPSYAGKGHIASQTVMGEGTLWFKGNLEQENFDIPTQQQEYLREIISFCNEKDIHLTFVSLPVTDFHLEIMQNYDDYVAAVNKFLDGTGISYYDFNLCNPAYLDLQYDGYYNDDNHLNTYGAKVFGKVFTDFFTGKIDKTELFCESYSEKRTLCIPRVLGIVIDKGMKPDCEEIQVKPIANTKELVVDCEVIKVDGGYRIMATVDGNLTNEVEIKDEELR